VGVIDRAIGTSLELRVLSYVIGLPVSLVAAWALLFAQGRPLHRVITRSLGIATAPGS